MKYSLLERTGKKQLKTFFLSIIYIFRNKFFFKETILYGNAFSPQRYFLMFET